MKETSLERFAYLSISAAILTMLLKTSAFFLTQSIGLLSDALESGINLVAALSALIAIRNLEEGHASGKVVINVK